MTLHAEVVADGAGVRVRLVEVALSCGAVGGEALLARIDRLIVMARRPYVQCGMPSVKRSFQERLCDRLHK